MGRARAQQGAFRRESGQDQSPARARSRRRSLCRPGHLGRNRWVSAPSPAFAVGGTIQIIVNNLIALYRRPGTSAIRSRYSSDIGKRLPIPIFHVNAEDAGRRHACRLYWRSSTVSPSTANVIIDLIGYRRHGHSEVDDPYHHPAAALRQNQESCAALYELYARQIGADPVGTGQGTPGRAGGSPEASDPDEAKSASLAKLPGYWSNYIGRTP